jgi:hypothetical protein
MQRSEIKRQTDMIRVKKEVIEFNTTTQDFVYDCIEGDLWVVQEIINGDNKKPNDVETY